MSARGHSNNTMGSGKSAVRGTYRVRAALRVLEVAETQYSAQKSEGGSEGAGGLARGDVLRVEVNNRLGSSAIMPD